MEKKNTWKFSVCLDLLDLQGMGLSKILVFVLFYLGLITFDWKSGLFHQVLVSELLKHWFKTVKTFFLMCCLKLNIMPENMASFFVVVVVPFCYFVI